MAGKIHGDYDELGDAMQSFAREASDTSSLFERVSQAVRGLEDGGWVGQGADMFYQEMNYEVLPAVRRLISALEDSAQKVQQIVKIFQQAEYEAGQLFRGEGSSHVEGEFKFIRGGDVVGLKIDFQPGDLAGNKLDQIVSPRDPASGMPTGLGGQKVSPGDLTGQKIGLGDLGGQKVSPGDLSGQKVSPGDLSGQKVSPGDLAGDKLGGDKLGGNKLDQIVSPRDPASGLPTGKRQL